MAKLKGVKIFHFFCRARVIKSYELSLWRLFLNFESVCTEETI